MRGRDRGDAVAEIMWALAKYHQEHRDEYDSTIAEDGVLGPAFLDILKGARSLLNGELGPHDAGTLDSALVAIGRAAGFEDKEI